MESPTNQPKEIPYPEIINQNSEWLYRLGAFRAAIYLKLWEKVARGSDTAERIADQEGWDLAGTRVLLDSVCAMKLMKKEGDRYSLTTEAAMYLDPAQPTYRGDLWLFEYNWEGDGKLADVIRTGKRPLFYDATKEEMTGVWKAHYSRGWVFPEVLLELADELWRSVDIQARDGLRVLDVACGPAPRSLALAYHNASVRLTWLDWNEVLQTALKAASKVGITDQISPLPGDLWLADMGANQYDVAYLGNMTHFFSPEQNIHLFSKIHSALVSGGIIVVNSGVRREDVAAIWDAIWLYVATAHGGSYNFIEYKEMLEQAGFTNIEDINLGPIRAVKP